ncbi:MAG: lactonase family protein [Lachnospiraceae bacterium]|nr:lactonase family protein [Lachnospiraceae bacterium]
MVHDFYVSGYAAPDEKGIIRYRFDADAKTIEEVDYVTGIENPTYMIPHPDGKKIYSGEKHKGEGEVVSYILDGTKPRVTAKIKTGGISPCHISLDPACEFLFAANYATGSLAAFRLNADGSLMERTDFIQFEGHGTNPARQDRPYIHYALCTGNTFYACDLGCDLVRVFDFDRVSGKLSPTDRNISVQPGDGPRHLALHDSHPGFLYLITEMGSRVYVLKESSGRYEAVQKIRSLSERHDVLKESGGKYEVIQKISSLPEGYDGPENTAAAIRFTEDGTRLLVSNRGHDSIAVYEVLPDGTLSAPCWNPSGGVAPRDFNIIGNYVISSNQISGDVVVYELDGLKLRETGIHTNFGHPSCVQPAM